METRLHQPPLQRQWMMAALCWMGLFALLFLLPVTVKAWKGDEGYIKELGVWVMVAITAIVALGCNVIVGYTGLLNLGFAGFYCIGAYTTAVLMKDYEFSFWIAMVIAMAHAAVWGILLGIPLLRLSGDYFAIVTLVVTELILLIVKNWTDVTGGTGGFRGVPRPEVFGHELSRFDPVGFWYLAMGFLIASIYVMLRLERSRIGRAWIAIREDELSAQAAGINITWYKTVAFAISAALAGLGGALFAAYYGNLSFYDFNFFISVFLVLYVIFGGSGSIVGTLLGTVVLFYSLEWLRDVITAFNQARTPEAVMADASFLWAWMRPAAQWLKTHVPDGQISLNLRYMLYAALLIIIMRYRPSGLLPPKAKVTERLRPRGERSLSLFHLKEKPE